MLTCHRPGFFPQSGSTTLHVVDEENSIGSFAVADDFGNIWRNFSKTGKCFHFTVNMSHLIFNLQLACLLYLQAKLAFPGQ